MKQLYNPSLLFKPIATNGINIAAGCYIADE